MSTPRWEDWEGGDFTVRQVTGDDGVLWQWLWCSACDKGVTASVAPRDLGYLSVDAQSHYERKHLSEPEVPE